MMTLTKTVFAMFVVCAFRYCRGFELSLGGWNYISYDLRSRPVRSERNVISLSFKTFHPSGLLLHSGGSMGHFITIELIHGKLRLTINLGSTVQGSGSHLMLLGDNLADYEWHKVILTRQMSTLIVKLDRTKRRSRIAETFTTLYLDQTIFVGGVNRTRSHNYHGADQTQQFIGCIRDITFDFIDLLYIAINKMPNYRSHGSPKFTCSRVKFKVVGFPTPNAHLYLTSFLSPRKFSLDFKFRSYDGNGALAFKFATNGKVYLSLVSGALVLEVVVGTNKPLLITVGEGLGDGAWHNVSAGVSLNEMRLVLDNQPEVQHQHPQLRLIGRFRRHLMIGRAVKRAGFVGCMYDIRVNNRTVFLGTFTRRESVQTTNKCNITSRCFPNACKNGGKCLQTWNSFSCDCQGIFYFGKRCEKPLLRSTCTEYKRLGVTEDSYCQIDPDGVGPLDWTDVLCNMTESSGAATVIRHNINTRQRVVDNAKNIMGFYFQRVKYKNDLATIRSIIANSKTCRQYISYECFQSPLLSSPSGPADVSWTSSTGVQMYNWGGAPSQSNKCACGVAGNCTDSSKYCNCDIGDSKWREDSGYLTDKQYLPVTTLRFASHAANSFFTLGQLECFGTSSNLKELRSLPRVSFVSAACVLVNPPPTTLGPSTARLPTRPRIPFITLSRTRKTTAGVPVVTSNPTTITAMNGEDHGHVTVTTVISTRDNSTVVTSVVKHKLVNASKEGVTIFSSIHTGKEGVRVHSTVSSKNNSVTLPSGISPALVTTPHPYVIIHNGSVSEVFIHHKSSARFTVLVVTTVLAFILVVLIIILFLKRSGHGYYFCFSCRSCGRKRQIPDIEVYRHSEVRCDSPDVIGFDDIRPNNVVECGSYNVQNGHVYHSSTLRKYVTFSESTSKL